MLKFERGRAKAETSQVNGERGWIVLEGELRKGYSASSAVVVVEAQLRELVDRAGSASWIELPSEPDRRKVIE